MAACGLLGLMGKALVIDEIHAYDAYMSEIIERLLEWCQALRIPVVLLSATLTAQKRKRLVEAYGGTLETVGDALSADHPGARREGAGAPRRRLHKAGRVPL